MDLRYRLAVVSDAGSGLGREIAVAVSRAGAAVLAVDPDLDAAERTAALVEAARVQAWALQVDLAAEDDLAMLAARARDLGGLDLMVTSGCRSTRPGHVDPGLRAPMRLTQLFLAGLPERRGRRDGTPAVVHVGAATGLVRFTAGLSDPAVGARVMAVVPGPASASEVTRTAVQLLCRGTAGEVVDLAGGAVGSVSSRARRRTT